MKCTRCGAKAVRNKLCKEHFLRDIEKRVDTTIEKYGLIAPGKKVCVAASGGKDSTTALYLVSRKYPTTALIIDEGIKGYRERTLADLKKFCVKNGIKLLIVTFKKEFGKTLDAIIKSGKTGQKPCTICGVLRRYLLNKYSRGYDKIVTGHNLDDEAQAIMMNLLRDQHDLLARLGPKTGVLLSKKFVPRVKPLYFCTEKEIAIYALLRGFEVGFVECPYSVEAFRADVREILNEYEMKHPGAKRNIIEKFLKQLPALKKEQEGQKLRYCDSCREPSTMRICNTCRIVERI